MRQGVTFSLRLTLRAVRVGEMDAIIRSMFGIRKIGRNEDKILRHGEGADAPGKAGFGAGEKTDLCHLIVLSRMDWRVRRWPVRSRMEARPGWLGR